MSTDSAQDARLAASPHQKTSMFRLILATSIGNALEFYDLIVYGYFATTLSKLCSTLLPAAAHFPRSS